MEENFKFYHEKLYILRKTKGMSQEEFAEKIGVSRQSIYAWECGKSMPDIENIYKMCKILGIEINELTNLTPVEREGKINIKKVKKIVAIILLSVLIIYMIMALRQFFILCHINRKVMSIEDYNNYSYCITRVQFENKEIAKTTDEHVYFKDGVLKVVFEKAGSENHKEIAWSDFINNKKYIFSENDTEKIVRKEAVSSGEKQVYQIKNIANSIYHFEENDNWKYFVSSLFWIWKGFCIQVGISGDCYILKSSSKDTRFHVDSYSTYYMNQWNGYPVENDLYKSNGTGYIEKYKNIKVNETTDEDIKMPDLDDYVLVEN